MDVANDFDERSLYEHRSREPRNEGRDPEHEGETLTCGATLSDLKSIDHGVDDRGGKNRASKQQPVNPPRISEDPVDAPTLTPPPSPPKTESRFREPFATLAQPTGAALVERTNDRALAFAVDSSRANPRDYDRETSSRSKPLVLIRPRYRSRVSLTRACVWTGELSSCRTMIQRAIRSPDA